MNPKELMGPMNHITPPLHRSQLKAHLIYFKKPKYKDRNNLIFSMNDLNVNIIVTLVDMGDLY